MKNRAIGILLIIAALSLLAGACAKPPTEEMNNAIEAVTRAENDPHAPVYAGNTLARARDALARMRAEADSKRYDSARVSAAEAVAAAERAISEGRAGVARARQEASDIIGTLGPAITETAQGIGAAKSAGLDLEFGSIDRDFNSARNNADQAEAALVQDKCQDAIDKGRAARAGLNSINQRLADAAMSSTRKK